MNAPHVLESAFDGAAGVCVCPFSLHPLLTRKPTRLPLELRVFQNLLFSSFSLVFYCLVAFFVFRRPTSDGDVSKRTQLTSR